ncbi:MULTISPECIES: ornithine cyclodeaminase family protein [unclassified Aureimonas]|uniref:ornithine cyclodeaminase family protein n=1 Tax=unclassified Aureimonas TaxID=2615206 RepID=UPI000700DE6A|nr:MULTISPECIES: ornithine cyclodeaminase family protein [unclassified Aureimonas]KQT64335.1 ornithine cyclodeaminase [Aureimonas sp. Leaf427]KQT81524.1 ornithine cyclodeaminase [Aureimonas sp. Leaf460]
MRLIDAAAVDAALDMPSVVGALREAFAGSVVQPVRHHHAVERGAGEAASTLLLMPAWTDFASAGGSSPGHIGVKIVTVSPDNARRSLPSVLGSYLLMDGATGAPLAVIDGQALTVRRTAAASALAASYLARPDSRRHLVIGAGALSAHLVRAMRSVRPIESVAIWNRSSERAEAVVAELRAEGIEASLAQDLAGAVAEADIVSAATLSRVPLIEGRFVRPGTHLDLVGAFLPDMRETDDAAVAAATVFVDTRGGALAEGGDLVQAIRAGAFRAEDVAADLHDLCRGHHPGRSSPEEITLFKSVGAALEDLAAAVLVASRS